MRIVLDTNVLVSGLLSPFGPPGEIVRMVSSGVVILCVDARILAEYDEVLARPRFGFDPDLVAALLDYIAFKSEVIASQPLGLRLSDPDDEPFLEVASSGGADFLVTGNLVHFPLRARAGVPVLSPAEFIATVLAQGHEKATGTDVSEDMREEYDFSRGARGTYAPPVQAGSTVVILDPDVAEVFPDSKAVNGALRALTEMARTQVRHPSR